MHGRATLRLCIMLLAFCLAAAGQAHAAQRVAVEGSPERGFGRLVLSFERQIPAYDIRLTSGILVFESDEAMEVSVDRLADQLREYVGIARADPDGRGVRMSLKQSVSVNTMAAGEQLFIDLLPVGWVGLPPSLPQAVIDGLARRSFDEERERLRALRAEEMATSPPVDLRVASAPTFTRFSFGWHKSINARVTREAGQVTILFDRAAPIEVDGLRPRLPAYIGEISSKVGVDGLEVSIGINPSASIRDFRDGNAFVVDISDLHAAETGPDTGMPAGVDSEDAAAPIRPDAGGAAGAVSIVETPLIPVWQTPAPQEAEDAAPAAQEPAARRDEPQAVATGVRRIGETYRIEFAFEQRTPSAMFGRGNRLWLVFDSPLPIDTQPLRRDLPDYVDDIAVLRSGDAQALVLRLVKPVLSSSAVENTRWIVTIGDIKIEPARPIALSPGRSQAGEPMVVALLEDAGSVRAFDDPVIGDRLLVATAMGPARAVLREQRFVDFTVLASRHGIAVAPKVDDLRVRIGGGTVSIERERGLVLSAAGAPAEPQADDAVESVLRPGYVHNLDASAAGPAELRSRGADFMRRIAEADEGVRMQARLGYAAFLLSARLAPEALGLLRLAAQEAPEVGRQPVYRSMLGIALQQMHRPAEALETFDFFGADSHPDIALWSGMALLDLGRWREAQLNLEKGMPTLADYPPAERARFMLGAARAATEANDLAAANELLNRLKAEPAAAGRRETVYLQARVAEGFGDREGAMERYDALVADDRRDQYDVLARLRRLDLLAGAGAIDDSEAIRALETLSVSWRGDDAELQTLGTLARLYVRNGEYRKAFETMKAAAIAAPGEPRTRALQDEMQAVFVELFLGGTVLAMAPIDALALYYDFKELTPVGHQGDEIIRVLADRLIDVDLLDQAGEVLQHQVEHRLRGAARARVAAKLALVHLMNRKPRQALQVIALSRQAALPAEIQNRRNLLEARALADTGRTDMALDLLRAASGPEAERLRADAYWADRRWQEAGEALERLAGDSWREDGALDETRRRHALRAAIAFALAGDDLGLARLREHFAGKMIGTADEQAFRVVAQPVKAQGAEFRAIAASVAHTDTLKAFIQEYREKYDRPQDVPQS